MKLKNIIKLMIGLGIFGYLVHRVGINNILSILPELQMCSLIPILPLYLTFLFISGYCMKLLSDRFNKIPYNKVNFAYMRSWVVGLLLPSKLGEFSIIHYLKKEGLTIGQGLAISLMDKLITLVLYTVVTFIGIFFFFEIGAAIKILLILSGLGIIFLSLLWLIFKGKFGRFMPKTFKQHFVEFKIAFIEILKHPFILLYNFFLTLIRFCLYSLMYSFYFSAFGLTISFIPIMVVNMITSLISMIPISINGLGLRQSVGVLLFTQIGISAVYSANVFIIALIVTYSVALCIFLISLKSK